MEQSARSRWCPEGIIGAFCGQSGRRPATGCPGTAYHVGRCLGAIVGSVAFSYQGDYPVNLIALLGVLVGLPFAIADQHAAAAARLAADGSRLPAVPSGVPIPRAGRRPGWIGWPNCDCSADSRRAGQRALRPLAAGGVFPVAGRRILLRCGGGRLGADCGD